MPPDQDTRTVEERLRQIELHVYRQEVLLLRTVVGVELIIILLLIFL